MNFVLVINALLIVAATLVVPNEYLAWNSWQLYAVQLFTLIPVLLGRTRYVKDLFLPTYFVLVYYLVNLTLGGFLVPRGYGWSTMFTPVVLASRQYNIITPFLLASNLILFWITWRSLERLARRQQTPLPVSEVAASPEWIQLLKMPLYLALFLAVTVGDVFSAFSFQFAIMIAHLTEPSLRRRFYRFGVYFAYLAVMLMFGFENKREIIMVLFLIVFLETYYSRALLSFRPLSLVKYLGFGVAFFALVLAASILRGYGEVPTESAIEAVTLIPQYITSDQFINGITDNLELNYSYGTTIASIDSGLRGLIDYQYGASLVKLLYLPIPRDVLPFKPESMLQLFTRSFAPDWWVEGGSLPVMFAADMFLNFYVFGLIPFALIWIGINELFVRIHTVAYRSFAFYSCIFICLSVLMFARGSGLEQWLVYFMFAAPVLLVVRLCGNLLRRRAGAVMHWVV